MFKKVLNFLLIFSIIISVSTICLATDEDISAEQPVVTSADDAVVTSIDGNTTEEGEDTHTHDDITVEGEDTYTAEEVYIPNDHFEIASNVTIDENTIIDGNAYIIAENVIIKGRIFGDLFVLANTVSIEGAYIYNNVFVCANNFTVSKEGVIYQLYAACNTINIGSDGVVYRDLLATAANITINGSVGRDAFVTASEQLNIIENETGRNIYNNLKYSAKSEIQIPEEAVAGEIEYTPLVEQNVQNNIWDYVFDLLYSLVFTAVVFLLITFLTPKFVNNSYNLITKSFGKTTLVGLIVLLIVPIISIALLFAPALISVSFALIAVYILILSIGTALVSICIANFIINKIKKDKKVILLLLTLAVNIVIWLLQLVPYLSIVISLAIALYTLGLIITNLLPKKEKLKEISKEEE